MEQRLGRGPRKQAHCCLRTAASFGQLCLKVQSGDGRTSDQRRSGRRWRRHLIEFGEDVQCQEGGRPQHRSAATSWTARGAPRTQWCSFVLDASCACEFSRGPESLGSFAQISPWSQRQRHRHKCKKVIPSTQSAVGGSACRREDAQR